MENNYMKAFNLRNQSHRNILVIPSRSLSAPGFLICLPSDGERNQISEPEQAMNAPKSGNTYLQICAATLARALVIVGLLFGMLGGAAHAEVPVLPGGGGSSPTNMLLDSWSFLDETNLTSDLGYFPISFTNLSFSWLGNGDSLVLATNVPAWLQYNVYENFGATNLTVDTGSLMFWYAAENWSSTNAAGTGPEEWTQLIDVGEWTTNASYGYWGLSLDPPGQNLWFVSQDGAGNTYTLSTPVSFTTNYFHCVALTYCSTNVAIYLDGELATNDPGGLSIWPGSEVLSNGVFFGSDPFGNMEAQGLFNAVQTYANPLSANDIQSMFTSRFPIYELNPNNTAMFAISSAPTSQTTYTATNSVIAGPGNLLWATNASSCVEGINAYDVWITNVAAKAAGKGTMSLQFTIAGGLEISNTIPFDVFANSVLSFGSNGVAWSWQGQGYRCNTYTLTNMPNATCFLILGTPYSSTDDGLTDAYKELVAKLSPTNYSSDGTGMADGWEILYFGHTGVSPTADPDGDGLTTFQEWLMNSQGYNPVKWNSFTNSPVGDGYQNYSGDGLANLMQPSFGGSMLTNNLTWQVNFSGDGFSDEYKTMVGLNTNSAVAAPNLPTYSQNPAP